MLERLWSWRSRPVGRCRCVDVAVQSYAATVELVPPRHMARDDGRGICVDVCLAIEITRLWEKGITTTGCCCGHGYVPAYIGVVQTDVDRMFALGYSSRFNPHRPRAKDSFVPKSVRPHV